MSAPAVVDPRNPPDPHTTRPIPADHCGNRFMCHPLGHTTCWCGCDACRALAGKTPRATSTLEEIHEHNRLRATVGHPPLDASWIVERTPIPVSPGGPMTRPVAPPVTPTDDSR